MFIGVYQPTVPGSTGQVAKFATLAGFSPRILSYYTSSFDQPFAAAFADEMQAAYGATILVQWQPRGVTNTQVADGSQDAVIRAAATAIKSDTRQVIVSYGQEMNGNWYPWAQADTPANYIAAYRHIHDIFTQMDVHNVTWLFDPNIEYSGSTPFSQLYPGDAYVDWVGLDGYFAYPTDTFQSLFGPSVTALRAITGKPLLIAESGVSGASGASQLQSLFSGADLAGAVGVVYFDETQTGDAEHQDWRLEDNATNMAAFKNMVVVYATRPLLHT